MSKLFDIFTGKTKTVCVQLTFSTSKQLSFVRRNNLKQNKPHC